MSRIWKLPIAVPAGVTVDVADQTVSAKGPKGQMSQTVHRQVAISQEDGQIKVAPRDGSRQSNMLAGTWRVLLNNMVTGVSAGFVKKLEITGVGYRAAVAGNTLNLTLGFSHPVAMPIPSGITIETPTQTEILIKGADRQQVGQVAADIRAYRPPEPYKGKGIKYSTEVIVRKEAKKA